MHQCPELLFAGPSGVTGGLVAVKLLDALSLFSVPQLDLNRAYGRVRHVAVALLVAHRLPAQVGAHVVGPITVPVVWCQALLGRVVNGFVRLQY